MPKGKAIKSAKQYGLMQAVAHGSAMDKAQGLSPDVANRLIHETSPKRRSAFSKKIKKSARR